MSNSRNIWLQAGYQFFSEEGPDGNRVSRLAKVLGRNKSSFYHYFATSEVFTEELLTLHLNNTQIMAQKMKEAHTLHSLISIIIDHGTDLLFNRQLRVHRQIAVFEACFAKTNEFVGNAFLPLWSKIIGLENNSDLSRLVLQLSVENFMLKITAETLNHSWLEGYFANLQSIVQKFEGRP